jgi:hypothetical protein
MSRPWFLLALLPLWLVACGDSGVGPADAGTAELGTADGAIADAMAPAALDESCTPSFELDLQDQGPGGQLFLDSVLDPEAFVQDVGRRVCAVLYREASEVRAANHITLIIKEDDIPGWKAGDVGNITVMVSSSHLLNVQSAGGDVAAELAGILAHEMTHMYQNDDKAQGEGSYPNLGNVIEGVADAVRIRLGYTPTGAQPSKGGSWDDQGYWKPAFFLLWVDHEHPGFIYQLNLSMVSGDGLAWTPESFVPITGRGVDEWWADYQEAACCSGSERSCCR